ncbi:hypothetical protein [Motiliproteus sp. MSK22-1]|uniref:hypothetical protein n=1 Tax=Motiliproteus sp. MSK22-1 TaxID=1897630 RepID=UPI000976523D|nr:hypothetical protein [Motiliproteus sp. MSK22-1]OMH28058.1 hypothetical protein BGP75_22080 [Motiliproteus sp. MSK22-1]
MDNQIASLQQQIIQAHSSGLNLSEFYSKIAPSGKLSEQTIVALQSNGFGEIPEVAVSVLWQTTLSITDQGVE